MRPIASLLAALLCCQGLLAQDGETPKPQPVPDAATLADNQKTIGERVEKIEETMRRIAKILEKDNPDQAARLKMAWDRSKNDQNVKRIEEIEVLLRQQLFAEAVENQRELEKALQRLMDILLDRDAERKELKDKIERLEDIATKLNNIIEDERRQFHNTEKFADPEKTLKRAEAAKAKLADLIQRQEDLIEKTKSPEADAGIKALEDRLEALLKAQKDQRGKKDPAEQEALAEKAAQLAKDIAAHAQGMPDALKGDGMGRANAGEQAAGATERASGGMQDAAAQMKGGQPFEPRQQDAEQDLREAQEALRRLAKRGEQHAEQRLAKDQERIRKDTQRLQEELEHLEKNAPGTDSGAGDLQKAQGDMGKAEGKLDSGNREDAVPHEKNAKEELEKAKKKLEELEKELKRLIELPDYDKLAQEQEKTAEDTEKLLDQMKKEGGQNGEGAPGTGNVEQGKRAMQDAERNLRGKSAKGANRNQQEAIERLEKAREELEEILRQLREEEQLMLLEALERRLLKMLQQQTQIHKETLALDIRLRDAGETPPRALVDKGTQLGDGEAELAVEAEKVLEILKEEGTTVVIPDVVEDLKMDLDGLAARLRKLDTGEYTQQVQRDVMETLRDLIEVIQEEMNRRQGGGQGGEPQEGEGEDPLLPTSAELKMLKALQERVNRRTSTFDRMLKKEENERERLAGKQEAVGTLTRTMADRLNKEGDQ